MAEEKAVSQKLAEGMERILGKGRTITVNMKHKDEVIKYLKKTEEAFEKTAGSKLHFGGRD